MKNNHYDNASQPRAAAEALRNYVFALADGLLVTVRARNEYEAARIAREQYICC